jgi:hypothetical protein
MTTLFGHLTEIDGGRFRASNGVVFDLRNVGAPGVDRNLQLRVAQAVDEVYAAAARGGRNATELVDGLARALSPRNDSRKCFRDAGLI